MARYVIAAFFLQTEGDDRLIRDLSKKAIIPVDAGCYKKEPLNEFKSIEGTFLQTVPPLDSF